jgi:hypothetical protein
MVGFVLFRQVKFSPGRILPGRRGGSESKKAKEGMLPRTPRERSGSAAKVFEAGRGYPIGQANGAGPEGKTDPATESGASCEGVRAADFTWRNKKPEDCRG